MRYLLLLALVPTLVGADRTTELSAYVNEFYSHFPDAKRIETMILTEENFPTVKDKLTRTNRRAHGTCYVGLAQINLTFWKKANEWQKRKVVFHELGHCAYQLSHTKDPFAFSIMNSVLWTVDDEGKNWPALVKELKTRVKKFGVRPL